MGHNVGARPFNCSKKQKDSGYLYLTQYFSVWFKIFVFLYFFQGAQLNPRLNWEEVPATQKGMCLWMGNQYVMTCGIKMMLKLLAVCLGMSTEVWLVFQKFLFKDIHRVYQQPNQNLDLFLLSSSWTMWCVTVLRPPCLTAATMKKKIVREMRQPGLFAQVCRHISF